MNRDPTSPLRRHPGDFGALFPWCITIVTGAWMAAVTWFHLRSPSVPAWRWWEAADSMVLSRAGAGDVVALWVDGQWWRVATAWLLHGSWLHWLINMVSLHSLWPWCVAAIGTARTFGALGLGSVVAVLASSYAGEGGVVVGLSGGLFGMAAVVMYERRGVCQEIRRHVGIAVLACLVLGIAIPWLWPQGPRLANIGHAAGWVVGGFWVGTGRRAERRIMRDWRIPVHTGVTLITLGFAVYGNRTMFSERMGRELLAREQWDVAASWLERAYGVQPDSPSRANALAYCWSLLGIELERAAELAEMAVAAMPEDANYLDTRGWIHCRSGETTEGLRFLRAALERADGQDPTILDHLDACADASVR